MKKMIAIVCIAAVVLGFGVVTYAANHNRTSWPEGTQGEQIPAEEPQMNREKPSDLPEMNAQSPRANGEIPSGSPDIIDFDAMVKDGVISQETCEKIKAYMEEHKPSDLPEMDGQGPEMSGQPPQMNGKAPSDLPEMGGKSPVHGGLLNDLMSNGMITQAEYDALCEALAR